MSDVLVLAAIRKVYETQAGMLEVLRGASLHLRKGEVVALLGPSGSGKSTLLQIAGLLDTPTAGEVIMMGTPMAEANDARRTTARGKHLGFVYQAHHLLPEFTALENVVLPQRIMGVDAKAATQRGMALLEQVGLAPRANHRPAKLSGGEQQRVALARALANSPALLLADEPTGNLDPSSAEEVFRLLMHLAEMQNLACLIATHNHDLAKRMSRAVQLSDGVLKPVLW